MSHHANSEDKWWSVLIVNTANETIAVLDKTQTPREDVDRMNDPWRLVIPGQKRQSDASKCPTCQSAEYISAMEFRINVYKENLPHDACCATHMHSIHKDASKTNDHPRFCIAQINGPFASEDAADDFVERWDRGAHTVMAKAASGEVLADMFGVECYGDIELVFRCDTSEMGN